MRSAIIVAFVSLAFAVVSAEVALERRLQSSRFQIDCMKQIGTTKDELATLAYDIDYSPNFEVKDDKLDVAKYEELIIDFTPNISPAASEKMMNSIKTCAQLSGETMCQTAAMIYKCTFVRQGVQLDLQITDLEAANSV